MDPLLISLFLGSFVGIVLALTGAGGAILAVPLLIFGLHLGVAQAAPIALLAVCLSATIGVLIALKQKKVRYRAAGYIALIGAIVAPAGLWIAHILPNTPLTLLFAAILLYLAFDMFSQSKRIDGAIEIATSKPFSAPCILDAADGRLVWTAPCVSALTLSGLLAGFLSGLLGVGGGFVVVPALKKVTNLQIQSILATSLAVVALVSATGVTAAIIMGSMNWSIALPFTGGAIVGMLLGRFVAGYIASSSLQRSFAVLAVCVSIGMIVKVI